MRKMHIAYFFATVFIVAAASGLFVFGGDVLKIYNNEDVIETISGLKDKGEDDNRVLGSGDNGGVESSGESGDSSGTSESVLEGNCGTQQVQYSLKNFNKNILCLEYAGTDCVKINVNCSVDLYNFEEGVDDIFGVEYSIIDLSDNKLDSRLVEGEVSVGTSRIISTEFILENESGVSEDLECVFDIGTVPEKRFC